MTNRRLLPLLLAAAIGVGAIGAGCGSSSAPKTGTGENGAASRTTVTSTTIETTTRAASASSLASSILAAFTQEQAADATYANVIARLGPVRPFTNIRASEEQHVATVTQLAHNHGVALPPGPFTGRSAPSTRSEACRLGATIERETIALYDGLLPQVGAYPDVTRAFGHLRAAALESHLPAFQRCS